MRHTFLQTITDDIIKKVGWEGLKDCTMVFPMQRAGLFAKQCIREKMSREGISIPVMLPQMTTIDQLADLFSPLRADEEIRSVCQLYTCYKRYCQDALDLDSFYGWGVQLLNDFSNADMALLDMTALMRNAADAAKLEELAIDKETQERLLALLGQTGEEDSIRKYYNQLWEAIPDIYREFTETQEKEGVGTRGARTRKAIAYLESEEAAATCQANKKYVFVGFNYLLAAERKLMEVLNAQYSTLFYWDNDPSFDLDEGVYQFIAEDIKRFGNDYPTEDIETEEEKANITVVACQSGEAQAQMVHKWLQETHHAGEQTAVVITDESMLEQVVYALPEGELFKNANITKGYPLKSTRIYAATIQQLSDTTRHGMPCTEVLQEIMKALEQAFRPKKRSEAEDWQHVLDAEAYYQTLTTLRKLQLLFEEQTFLKEHVSKLKTLRNLIRRKLDSITIPFHGEPITDIQIIGVLETRLLDFDNVLILSAEEGVVPNTAADRSFIPYDLRKAHKMQTREEESKIYAYNFFRLMRRSRHVAITFSDAFTDEGKKSMSRFLMQMLTDTTWERRITRYRMTESATRGAVTPIEIKDEHPKIPHPLSPSAISDYVECKREFYLKHVLKLREAENDTLMFNQAVIGTLVHGTLQSAYLDICHAPEDRLTQEKTVTKSDIEAYLKDPKQIETALYKAYKELNETYRKHHPETTTDYYIAENHQAENAAIMEMVRKVLEKDAKDAPITLICMEKEVRYEQLHGIIDRLDIVHEEGQEYLRVLDYKTGGYKEEKLKADSWSNLFTDPDKKYVLQTLLYCYLVEQTGLNTYKRKLMPELRFTKSLSADPHIRINKDIVNDYQAIREDFEKELRENLTAIYSTIDFPATDNLKVCSNSYCPFHLLCGREKKE